MKLTAALSLKRAIRNRRRCHAHVTGKFSRGIIGIQAHRCPSGAFGGYRNAINKSRRTLSRVSEANKINPATRETKTAHNSKTVTDTGNWFLPFHAGLRALPTGEKESSMSNKWTPNLPENVFGWSMKFRNSTETVWTIRSTKDSATVFWESYCLTKKTRLYSANFIVFCRLGRKFVTREPGVRSRWNFFREENSFLASHPGLREKTLRFFNATTGALWALRCKKEIPKFCFSVLEIFVLISRTVCSVNSESLQ